MSESATAIERRPQGDALSTIIGTGDTRSALAQLETNVRDIIEVCRERGFITHYRNENKKTGEIRESDFYGLPAWQLLGMTYGVTPIVTTLDAIDGGFKAYAVARTRDGMEVGGDFGLCHRKESGKQYKSDHDLAAMASARAKRNALRSALGAALVLAGFDFPDPDAPATKEQVGFLHQLERELGWEHDQGHAEAGEVESFKDLTREEASVLIDRWTALRDGSQEKGGESKDPAHGSSSTRPSPAKRDAPGDVLLPSDGEGEAPTEQTTDPGASDPDDDKPASQELWAKAKALDITGAKALRLVNKGRDPKDRVKNTLAITGRELRRVLEEQA